MYTFQLRNLLNETLESYYWLGFLFADGHFALNGTMTLQLQIKDLGHIKKLEKFLELKNRVKVKTRPYTYKGKIKTNAYVQLTICDKFIMDILIFKYKLNNIKTYKPPNISSLINKKLLSFLAGYIDGDGSIAIDGNCKIKCHKNWLNNFIKMYKNSIIFIGKGSDPYINKNDNYCYWFINKSQLVRLKIMCEKYNLPLLHRKWDRVISKTKNNKFVTIQNRVSKLSKKDILDMKNKYFNLNIEQKEIAKIYNVNKQMVNKAVNDKIKYTKDD